MEFRGRGNIGYVGTRIVTAIRCASGRVTRVLGSGRSTRIHKNLMGSDVPRPMGGELAHGYVRFRLRTALSQDYEHLPTVNVL